MKLKLASLLVGTAVALICAETAMAADLHPIVEVQSGYLSARLLTGNGCDPKKVEDVLSVGCGA